MKMRICLTAILDVEVSEDRMKLFGHDQSEALREQHMRAEGDPVGFAHRASTDGSITVDSKVLDE